MIISSSERCCWAKSTWCLGDSIRGDVTLRDLGAPHALEGGGYALVSDKRFKPQRARAELPHRPTAAR